MEENKSETEADLDFPYYYDTDFETQVPVSNFCSALQNNLGLDDLWWIVILLQLSASLPLVVLQRLCNLLPVLSMIHLTNILTLYLNISLWIWAIYLILALSYCNIGIDNPILVTGIVFVSIFGLCSLLDCLFGREGWYLVDLKLMSDAVKYFDKLKSCPPAHRVHIECFHTRTVSALNTRGTILTRNKKQVTYTDHRDFPMTSWSDMSDWPLLETLANQGANIIGVSLEREVEPGDQITKDAFDSFRTKFVQQNCHRDEQMRTWVTCEIPDMGPEQSIFINTKPREEMPTFLKIGLFLLFSAFCLSCPIRTYIRKKTKLITLKVRKVYFFNQNYQYPEEDVKNNYKAANNWTVPVPNKMDPLVLLSPQARSVLLTPVVEADNHTRFVLLPLVENIPHAASPKPEMEQKNHELSNNERLTQLSNNNEPNIHNNKSPSGNERKEQMEKQNNINTQNTNNNITHQLNTQPANNVTSGGYNQQQNKYQNQNHNQNQNQPYNKSNDVNIPREMPDYDSTAPNWHNNGPLYLPGKDYYDPPSYRGQRNNLVEEDERLYNTTHPRVAMLKNTNVESERMARRDYGRRVHYSEDGGRYRRYQSPSPGPRHTTQHRSRRTYSEDQKYEEGKGGGAGTGYRNVNYLDTDLLVDEVRYNA